MKRFWFFIVASVMIFSVTSASFGEEHPAKAKMIKGNISKVDCGKATIALTNVKNLKNTKEKLPDVTVTLGKGTKLTGAKKCEELQAGNLVFISYEASDQGNVATEVMLTKQKELEKSLRERNVKNTEELKKQTQQPGSHEELIQKRLQERSARKGELDQNESKEEQPIEKDQGQNNK